MEGTGYKAIRWEQDEVIGLLVLNTPPSNAMTTGFFEDMASWEISLRDNPLPFGIIVRGAGRHFSSGADLQDLLDVVISKRDPESHSDPFGEQYFLSNCRSFVFLEELDIPVVAAIRGVCIGSAFELALHCHFRFCTEDAVLGLPESTFHLMPGIGGIRKVAALAGDAAALELSLRGNTFGAREALELGLVDQIVPRRELEPLAKKFILQSGKNYHRVKRSLYLKRYFTAHGIINS